MTHFKKALFASLFCFLCMACNNGDDGGLTEDFENFERDVRFRWRLDQILLKENGQADTDVTPDCEVELDITETTYQETINSGTNCENQVVSEAFPYVIVNNNILEVLDENSNVIFSFIGTILNQNTLLLAQENINGNPNLSAEATYTKITE